MQEAKAVGAKATCERRRHPCHQILLSGFRSLLARVSTQQTGENSPGLPMPPSKETRKGIGLETKETEVCQALPMDVGSGCVCGGVRGGNMSPARYFRGCPKCGKSDVSLPARLRESEAELRSWSPCLPAEMLSFTVPTAASSLGPLKAGCGASACHITRQGFGGSPVDL